MEKLTKRQKKIAMLVMEGHLKEVTELCHSKEKTLKKHLASIRKVLGVSNTPELICKLCDNDKKSLKHLKFTKRGKQIFLLIIQGFTSKEIAEQIGIVESTVKDHRKIMLRVNKCSDISELILMYYNKNQIK